MSAFDFPTSSALLAVARGESPADLLLRNGQIVNVFSGEIEQADIAIADGIIAGVGKGYDAKEIVDLQGAYVAPGLIDAHVHIESSLCLPAQFAAAVVPRGVTTVIADPHEIANVAGAAGVRFMRTCADAIAGVLRVVLMAPSCVPATNLATAGATLRAGDLAALQCHGLAEVMNFPGVIAGDEDILRKLDVFRYARRPIDGHAPGVSGNALNAYVAAGIGTDHECVTLLEAQEKLARGMYVLIREATNARNLAALLPLISSANERRICFCTDDRTPCDLLDQGSVDHMLREAIAAGIDPVTAFRICTLNPAECFGLHDRGAIAPGKTADLFIFDDLESPRATRTYVAGRLVAENGKLFSGMHKRPITAPQVVLDSMHATAEAISLSVPNKGKHIRVIGSRRDQLLTDSRLTKPLVQAGLAIADPSRDLLKMAVIERHRGSGRVGLGFIEGFGFKRGAIAGTVAHDHHNIIAIGADDASMMTAIRSVISGRGGLAVGSDDAVLATLALPVAGLMSDQSIAQMRAAYDELLAATRELGSTLRDPFMAMSFMALEVIPSLKLTDRGLVDVNAMRIVDLFV